MSLFRKSLVLSNSNFKRAALVPFRTESFWSSVQQGPPDPIFGVTEAYNKDSNPKKVLLGVGAYRTDDGKPFVLPSVRKAEEMLITKNLNHEYLPQGGLQDFCKAAATMAFGENSCVIQNGLNLTVQALSGTGALRLGTAFFSMFHTGPKVVYLPNPTWGNHKNICKHAGLEFKFYKYYNPEKVDFDFCGTCEDIRKIPEKSIILFHAVAHNPTGFDPTMEQWEELSKLCMERNLLVFFDMAYQGFASGDYEKDAAALRLFVNDGHRVALATSYAKNMGLYGERIGAFTLLAGSKEEVAKMNSQLKIIVRAMYSTPPLYGARLVTLILTDNSLKCQWIKDIKEMSSRIKSVRKVLVDNLKKAGSQKNWDHITRQIGMFSFTGLTKEQVQKLTKEHSVYLTSDGRISVASLGSKNVEYVAKAMHEVSK